MGLALDEPTENDEQFPVEGITFVVEKHLAKSWPEVKIDFRDSWMGKGFIINTGAAGC